MRRSAILALIAAVTVLQGCGDTYFERGATGALIGAGAAVAVDEDPATGALIGAGVGVLTTN